MKVYLSVPPTVVLLPATREQLVCDHVSNEKYRWEKTPTFCARVLFFKSRLAILSFGKKI
jgi:hypothetical protein